MLMEQKSDREKLDEVFRTQIEAALEIVHEFEGQKNIWIRSYLRLPKDAKNSPDDFVEKIAQCLRPALREAFCPQEERSLDDDAVDHFAKLAAFVGGAVAYFRRLEKDYKGAGDSPDQMHELEVSISYALMGIEKARDYLKERTRIQEEGGVGKGKTTGVRRPGW
jgi:hypothetical protein